MIEVCWGLVFNPLLLAAGIPCTCVLVVIVLTARLSLSILEALSGVVTHIVSRCTHLKTKHYRRTVNTCRDHSSLFTINQLFLI